MKKLLPLVVLAAASCQPAYAETQVQMLERICVLESETAGDVMGLRQLGVPIGKTLSFSDEPSYKVIVHAAYSMDRYNTKQYQEASIREFSNAAFFHCLERHKE